MGLDIKCKLNVKEKYWDIKLNGEVDIASAPYFRSVLTDSYEETQEDIRLDATELSYIDSTGLGVIIGAYGRMQENGKTILVENPRSNVKKLLQITSLDKILCSQ